MSHGEDITPKLYGVKFGFRDERYYPRDASGRWVECIHFVVDTWHVGRVLASNYPHMSSYNGFMLSIHKHPPVRDYYRDPREAVRPLAPIKKWNFDGLDPLTIVALIEDWKSKTPLISLVADEAAVLSLPS